MRKSGLQMLLSSMGIEIDPAEIMQKYNEAKDIMSNLAAFVNTLDARLARIEKHLGVENGDNSNARITADNSGVTRTNTGAA